MKTSRLKPVLFLSLIFANALFFFACNNDDDDNSPPEGSAFPVVMSYHSITDTELLLWVGGEPASTDGLNPEDLFSDEDLLLVRESYYENQALIFTEDSVAAPGFEGLLSYNFENDSLFGTIDFAGAPLDVFIGTGDFTELVIPQGIYNYCAGSGSGSVVCGSGGGNDRFTPESIISDETDLSADDFGPNDSLAVYNINVIFRP